MQAQETHHYSLSQVFIILKDVLKNPNLQLFFVFKCLMAGTMMLNSNLGQVYLTNDLKFPAEKLSLIKVMLAPVEIVLSLVSGYLSSTKPFAFSYKIHILCSLISTYTILILFGFFPKEKEEIESTWTIVHVCGLNLVSSLFNSCLDTGSFSIIFSICDKRISGVYITLLATVYNLSSYVHKLYLFNLV